MKKKKILMMLNAPYPADIRVKKETSALLQAGYEIFLLCLRRKNEAIVDEADGIKLIRIDAGKNNYQLAFWDVVMSMNFVHPKFKSKASKILMKEGIEVIHVHDLPLAGTALTIKKKNNSLKVIIDLHENYAEAIKIWFKWKRNPIVRLKNFLFLNPSRWARFEKIACSKADYVIAVVEEMKERLINAHQLHKDKVTIVTNSESRNFIQQQVDFSVYKNIPKGFIITYSGGIGPHRGIEVAIKGMAYLTHLPIHLVIIGFGSTSAMNFLKDLTHDLNLNNITFLGHQPFEKFYSFMHLADANVIPHQSNGNTDCGIPHKLFQGMMAAKPLIVSSSPPLKRYIETYNCGVVFNVGDPVDFAEKAKILFNDKSLHAQLSKNAYKVSIEGSLNWESTQKELINLYNEI